MIMVVRVYRGQVAKRYPATVADHVPGDDLIHLSIADVGVLKPGGAHQHDEGREHQSSSDGRGCRTIGCGWRDGRRRGCGDRSQRSLANRHRLLNSASGLANQTFCIAIAQARAAYSFASAGDQVAG